MQRLYKGILCLHKFILILCMNTYVLDSVTNSFLTIRLVFSQRHETVTSCLDNRVIKAAKLRETRSPPQPRRIPSIIHTSALFTMERPATPPAKTAGPQQSFSPPTPEVTRRIVSLKVLLSYVY